MSAAASREKKRTCALPHMNFRPALVAAMGMLADCRSTDFSRFGEGSPAGFAVFRPVSPSPAPAFSLRRTAAALGIFLCWFALLGRGLSILPRATMRGQGGGRIHRLGDGWNPPRCETALPPPSTLSALYFDGERTTGKMDLTLPEKGCGRAMSLFSRHGDAECVLVGRRPLCAQRFCRWGRSMPRRRRNILSRAGRGMSFCGSTGRSMTVCRREWSRTPPTSHTRF